MLSRLFILLFYPWIRAWTIAAYNEFCLTSDYEVQYSFGGIDQCLVHFYRNIDRYSSSAFSNSLMKIIFTPWSFVDHPDFENYHLKIHVHERVAR